MSAASLDRVPSGIESFAYDRTAQQAGIVHFGIGAFHRAHMAVYTEAAMNAGDRDWGIIGVSLRSPDVAEQLNPQDGLYTVASRSAQGSKIRVIGAVQRVLVAADTPDGVVDAVAAASTRILSFTITEKGYCRSPDGELDLALATDASVFRILADGLALRRARGLTGLTLLSCDNLARNGEQVARLLRQYLAVRDPALGDWVTAQCTFPSSMVDRIVPATTSADRDTASEALGGLRDAGHVVTEPFSQWVIEDRFAQGRPNWEAFGAQIVDDVRPYESAKLRMLNGAHSALAYLGLERGKDTVYEAITDPEVRAIIETLLRDEAAPSIETAPEQDLAAYADALLARFANPALDHRLRQIAIDGSQKIPQRWLDTLAWHERRGRQCPAILLGVAAWLRHVRGDNALRCGPVDDPLASSLKLAWGQGVDDSVVEKVFGRDGLLPSHWRPNSEERSSLRLAEPYDAASARFRRLSTQIV